MRKSQLKSGETFFGITIEHFVTSSIWALALSEYCYCSNTEVGFTKTEARELRIGNYVQYEDCFPQPIKVKAIDEVLKFIDSIETSIIGLQHITPIPLTEEWLEKLGCKKHSDYCYKIPNTDYEFDFRHQRIIHFDGGLFDGGLKVKADFVHEFQNVVFDLTGEELTKQ